MNLKKKKNVMANVPFCNNQKQQTGQGKLTKSLLVAKIIGRNQLLHFCCHILNYNSKEWMA